MFIVYLTLSFLSTFIYSKLPFSIYHNKCYTVATRLMIACDGRLVDFTVNSIVRECLYVCV